MYFVGSYVHFRGTYLPPCSWSRIFSLLNFACHFVLVYLILKNHSLFFTVSFLCLAVPSVFAIFFIFFTVFLPVCNCVNKIGPLSTLFYRCGNYLKVCTLGKPTRWTRACTDFNGTYSHNISKTCGCLEQLCWYVGEEWAVGISSVSVTCSLYERQM